ncbi:hypothetical protein CKA32_002099 [Geitlerinema sp. FC II]|nr:hypothetical protein CKA32_002099 [Geitlerinema sp. FC II]
MGVSIFEVILGRSFLYSDNGLIRVSEFILRNQKYGNNRECTYFTNSLK